MKIKFLILCLLIANLFSCSIKRESILIGERIYVDNDDFVELINKESNEVYNDAFFVSDFYIKNFYDQLQKEAIDLKSDKHISDLLTNSNHIIINIGNYEFLRFINYEYNMFEYDEKIINENVELFGHYLGLLLESLIAYNDNITIISPYPYLLLENNVSNMYLGIIETYMTMVDIVTREFNINNIKTIKTKNHIIKNKVLSKIGAEYLIQMSLS